MIHTEASKFVIELENESGSEYETITINDPKTLSDISTGTTKAILNAAKAVVDDSGTSLILTKSGDNVARIKQSYIQVTSKTWVDDPVTFTEEI